MDPARRLETLGPYTLGQRLGLGGMAEVFEAESPELGRVALKRILPSLAEDREFSEMFWDEARITSRIEHPNVVKVLDYGRIDEQLYMALEYVDGPSTAKLLRRAASKRASLDASIVLSLAVQLLEALVTVHEARDDHGQPLRIVHRDVSPGNIMLTSAGQVKLGDFGIVRSEVVVRRTQPGELKGKIGYMSPEQAVGGQLDPRSDLFSVGVVLAELLILRPLLLGKNEMQTLSRTVQADLSTWRRYNRHVPETLQGIVERALNRDANRRFQTAREMLRAVLDVAAVHGLELSPRRIAVCLRELGFLEDAPATGASGERQATRPGRAAQTEAVRSPSGEMVIQALGAAPQYAGHPGFRTEFRDTNLPMQLIAALRRTWDGGVQLNRQGWTTALELVGGRIVAAHDSSGVAPLGRLLVEAGVIQQNELARAIGESRRAGLRLGEYLVLRRRLRESTLRRLLGQQTLIRLRPWFSAESGTLSVFTDERAAPHDPADGNPDSLAQAVAVLRDSLSYEGTRARLSSAMDAVLLPAHLPVDLAELGLTGPETRVLQMVVEGGPLEGASPRRVIDALAVERLARPKEAAFALLMGLCCGVIHAPGFGRHH